MLFVSEGPGNELMKERETSQSLTYTYLYRGGGFARMCTQAKAFGSKACRLRRYVYDSCTHDQLQTIW